jgi:hypothetical protein
MTQREPRAEHNKRERRPLRATLGGSWSVRKSKRVDRERFVKIADDVALMIMRCAFEHSATWAVFWAVFWKTQAATVVDKEAPADISITDLVDQTGYSRPSIFRGLAELKDRGMVAVVSGGGRRHKSAFWLTDPGEWLI